MASEKELRLALVCFGGVSLAVYMHGVTKEVLKLVRASRSFHDIDPGTDVGAPGRRFAVRGSGRRDTPDTEHIYFELLQRIGGTQPLKIVVDVIAGASAGGINGVLLGRALAHDLDYDPLRAMWLQNSDVEELLEPTHRASQRSKWYMRPLLWLFRRSQVMRLTSEPEMRRKLSLFVRSRWFRPPFSGRKLSSFVLDALAEMGDAERRRSSLLPRQHALDLFVTVTDFYGYAQRIPLHDPPYITEHEHRHVFNFCYRRSAQGEVRSDFADDSIPALAFAARATASFPGAFPPARLRELDKLIADRGGSWPGRYVFAAQNFKPYLSEGASFDDNVFIDGSVLNNKPFAEAINAIRDRPAYRQIDRRLVYIDPHPDRNQQPRVKRLPGFFLTLKGALSDIPRSEPVRDELQFVLNFNERIEQLKSMLDGAQPQIEALVQSITGDAIGERPATGYIQTWRNEGNVRAAREAGFAYQGYIHLKLNVVITTLAGQVAAAMKNDDLTATAIAAAITDWAKERGIFALNGGNDSRKDDVAPWIDFLVNFDVDYRTRRLRFVIRQLNLLYEQVPAGEQHVETIEQLDDIKHRLYDSIEELRRRTDAASLDRDTLTALGAVDWQGGVGIRHGQIGRALTAIAANLDMLSFNDRVDALFGEVAQKLDTAPARAALLRAYVGFAFWDVLAFTMTGWQSLGEYDEIKVDRISPDDATTLRGGGAKATLKGIDLGHFAAFFSRAHRENDYLWGRLHGAERMIDIVCDCAGGDAPARAEIDRLKREAFGAILVAEKAHFGEECALIDELLAQIGHT